MVGRSVPQARTVAENGACVAVGIVARADVACTDAQMVGDSG